MRSAVKAVREAAAEQNATDARKALASALQIIDRTAQKGVIHRNTAARTKSRLNQLVAHLS